MVYISRLFITVLTFISFFSWGELLDDKYVVCNATEGTKTKKNSFYPVRGFSFQGNKVQLTFVQISGNGGRKDIYEIRKDNYITNPDFIEWGEFEEYQLNRKNLKLRINKSLNLRDPDYHYYNCELSDKKNFKKTMEKYAEIEQDAVREAWEKATEGNKI